MAMVSMSIASFNTCSSHILPSSIHTIKMSGLKVGDAFPENVVFKQVTSHERFSASLKN